MTIPKEILEKWAPLQSQGDSKKLVELTGKSEATISRALNSGSCVYEVFIVIRDFYADRAKTVTV